MLKAFPISPLHDPHTLARVPRPKPPPPPLPPLPTPIHRSPRLRCRLSGRTGIVILPTRANTRRAAIGCKNTLPEADRSH